MNSADLLFIIGVLFSVIAGLSKDWRLTACAICCAFFLVAVSAADRAIFPRFPGESTIVSFE